MPLIKNSRDFTDVEPVCVEEFNDFLFWQFRIDLDVFDFEAAVSKDVYTYCESVELIRFVFRRGQISRLHPNESGQRLVRAYSIHQLRKLQIGMRFLVR